MIMIIILDEQPLIWSKLLWLLLLYTTQQYVLDSKRIANGGPMFGQQTDLNLPTQPFVH